MDGTGCEVLFVKKLSAMDGFTARTLRLPRSEARKFLPIIQGPELKNRNSALATVADESGRMFDLLCTCAGGSYIISRIGLMFSAHNLRPGHFLIFWQDSHSRLRVATRRHLPPDTRIGASPALQALRPGTPRRHPPSPLSLRGLPPAANPLQPMLGSSRMAACPASGMGARHGDQPRKHRSRISWAAPAWTSLNRHQQGSQAQMPASVGAQDIGNEDEEDGEWEEVQCGGEREGEREGEEQGAPAAGLLLEVGDLETIQEEAGEREVEEEHHDTGSLAGGFDAALGPLLDCAASAPLCVQQRHQEEEQRVCPQPTSPQHAGTTHEQGQQAMDTSPAQLLRQHSCPSGLMADPGHGSQPAKCHNSTRLQQPRMSFDGTGGAGGAGACVMAAHGTSHPWLPQRREQQRQGDAPALLRLQPVKRPPAVHLSTVLDVLQALEEAGSTGSTHGCSAQQQSIAGVPSVPPPPPAPQQQQPETASRRRSEHGSGAADAPEVVSKPTSALLQPTVLAPKRQALQDRTNLPIGHLGAAAHDSKPPSLPIKAHLPLPVFSTLSFNTTAHTGSPGDSARAQGHSPRSSPCTAAGLGPENVHSSSWALGAVGVWQPAPVPSPSWSSQRSRLGTASAGAGLGVLHISSGWSEGESGHVRRDRNGMAGPAGSRYLDLGGPAPVHGDGGNRNVAGSGWVPVSAISSASPSQQQQQQLRAMRQPMLLASQHCRGGGQGAVSMVRHQVHSPGPGGSRGRWGVQGGGVYKVAALRHRLSRCSLPFPAVSLGRAGTYRLPNAPASPPPLHPFSRPATPTKVAGFGSASPQGRARCVLTTSPVRSLLQQPGAGPGASSRDLGSPPPLPHSQSLPNEAADNVPLIATALTHHAQLQKEGCGAA